MTKTLRQKIYFVLVCASLLSCQAKKGLNYQTFKTGNGWGYNILLDQQVLIHQDILPVRGNVNGFSSEGQASAAATIVMRKLGRRENPSLTEEDVKMIQTR